MSEATVADAITTRVESEIETAQSVPVGYENVNFVPPDDSPYVRQRTLFFDARQIDLGSSTNTDRVDGEVLFQVYAPFGAGDKVALDLALACKVAFRKVAVGGATFRVPTIGPVGRTGGEYRIDVSCPFFFDELT